MEKSEQIWLDGRFVPWDAAQVHVLTHTLHYGLGVFEGIRCYEAGPQRSAIFRLPEHVARLFDSAHILGLKIPFTREQIAQACIDAVRVNRLRSCYIRPLVFLGEGEMGLAAVHNPVRVAVVVWHWGAYLGDEGVRNGIRLKTASFQRFHVNTLMSKAKAVGHYVNSILAAIEARRSGYDEALMLDTDGYVAECSGENIFVVRHGVVKTTPLGSVLAGITRDTAMTLLAEGGVHVREERFTRDELYIADEVFMTGTAAEVTPVREVDDRQVGAGSPGAITQTLQRAFAEVVAARTARYESWLSPIDWP
ncbi:MAG TPA: branched-chain amino acid transaminase [Candidatus Kryptonia bacterium]|nr:branched-chain amino acid transaminase [Candidatus Kryptonia bacterium]